MVAAVLPAVAFLRDLIDQPIEPLDDASAALTITRVGGGGATAGAPALTHRLVFGLSSAATYLIYSGGPADLALTEASGARPVIRDPVRLTQESAGRVRARPGGPARHDPSAGRALCR